MIKFVPTKYECIGKNNRIYIGTIKNSMLNKTRVNNISNQQAIKESTKSGFLTKKEAQIHETEMKARLKEKGTLNQGTNKTFNDVFEEFMESEGKNLSSNSLYA